MLVGSAGSGKSVLVGAKLSSLNPEEYMVKNVPFNYYTTSAMLQGKQPNGLGCGPLKGQQSSCAIRAGPPSPTALLPP